jgi:molybdenum cofactor guanylyltransferase
MNVNNIQAYILAGGKSSRMGTEKGLVSLQGQPFIEHIIRTLKNITRNISILSNNNLYNHLGFPVLEDIEKEKGPLGGIHTGLVNSNKEYNLFVSCDIPLINTQILNHLIAGINHSNNTFIASHGSNKEPLCGIYSKKNTALINELLDKNELSVHKALEHLNAKYIDVSTAPFYNKNIFYNINSKEELKKLEEELLCTK